MSLPTIGRFFSYEDITLKLFMKVIETGNFKLVLKSGFATDSLCLQQWEKIVLASNQVRGKNDYGQFLKAYHAYNRLLQDFNGIKATLMVLCYVLDYERIKWVRAKGYKIDLKNSQTYATSLAAAIRKSDNIMTKLTMKKNELVKMGQEAKEGKDKAQTFQAVMAALSVELGQVIPDDLLLSRYNEFVKLIEQRQRALKAAQQRQKYGS
jgi:hypothetical protein